MAQIRVVVEDRQAGPRFRRRVQRFGRRVRPAMREVAQRVAREIVEAGRADITSAGNFGARWTDGLQAEVGEGRGNIRVLVTMAVPYWTVFQEGRVIEGKPLLWIPLSFATDAKGVRARDYQQPLFRVDRLAGAPLLMTGSGRDAEPKYFGTESVTIPKKFRLREIAAEIARTIPDLYRAAFRRGRD